MTSSSVHTLKNTDPWQSFTRRSMASFSISQKLAQGETFPEPWQLNIVLHLANSLHAWPPHSKTKRNRSLCWVPDSYSTALWVPCIQNQILFPKVWTLQHFGTLEKNNRIHFDQIDENIGYPDCVTNLDLGLATICVTT